MTEEERTAVRSVALLSRRTIVHLAANFYDAWIDRKFKCVLCGRWILIDQLVATREKWSNKTLMERSEKGKWYQGPMIMCDGGRYSVHDD